MMDHVGSSIQKLDIIILSLVFDISHIKEYKEGVKEKSVKKTTSSTSYTPNWNVHGMDSKDMRT